MIDFKRAPVVGIEDLVMLPQLTEKAIVENLKLRHSKDMIYTNIGPVLISVNPFKKMSIYTEEQINFYRTHGKTTTTPHIFALAEDTYRTMVLEEEHQCVIISGESGAGKTEASKQIMQYVAAVSGNSEKMQRVKQIMLESNPLLEAFGNAKTVRNDNSSRFGKFFEIYFDRMGGPLGGKMSNFLLEKSRVVKLQKGERNFHIFYQLCAGADATLRAELGLRSAAEFRFLNQGQTLDRAGISDVQEFQDTVHAMDSIGITKADQKSIFSLLACILHLGEMGFVNSGRGGAGAEEFAVDDRSVLERCARLLAVDANQLDRAMTWKKLEMGSEVVNVPLDKQQCSNARDAIAKVIYDKIFDFIVESVNLAFGKQSYNLMLGVLDIYGFEIFEKNGFEQFCINYVNEKLQQIFIELTLKVEQEEYVREKIKWEEIKYFNNKIVCELIEGKNPPGLFSVIDDVCATMAKEVESVADLKMLDKLGQAHCGHPHFRQTERGFIIRHYAGDVQYDTQGFTSRNKDLLSSDLMLVLSTSSNPFLAILLESVDIDIPGSPSVRSPGARKKATTVGFKIREQAAELIKTLMNCNPHYVRTVKPNDEKRANYVDDQRLTHQVKYLGLLENVRVRRAGFSYRQYFDKFLKRFKFCCPQTFPRPFRGSDKDACLAILDHCAGVVPREGWQLGETKLFIRQPHHLFALEDVREGTFDKLVAKIHRQWFKFIHNKEYIILKLNMDKIYAKAGKQRRAASVFRPYQGEYINYRTDMAAVHSLVEYDPIATAWKEYYADGTRRYFYNYLTQQTQWKRPAELDKQRIYFTGKVDRVVNHNAGQKIQEFMIVSDRAIYFIEETLQTIVTPPTKPSKQNPRPPPPPAPYTITQYILKKRLDIRLLSGLSVSTLADPFAVIHFYPAPVPYRPIVMTPVKGTTHCQLCQVKFTPAAKKANCPGCGLLLCLKNCLVHQRALPTLGYPKPVKVCAHCITGEPHEPTEDVVISHEGRSEIVAMIRKTYKRVMGSKIPININDTITYQLAGEKHLRQVVFTPNHEMQEATLFVAPNQLAIHVPPGISQEKIQAIEASREQRRIAAQERHKQEREEAIIKEAQKEKEREEAHRRMVEERKQRKLEMEEREERDRLDRERAMREKKEKAERYVQERLKR